MDNAFTIPTLERIFQSTFSLATDVKLLWKGKESFEIIFNSVKEAERLICLQFYILRMTRQGGGCLTY